MGKGQPKGYFLADCLRREARPEVRLKNEESLGLTLLQEPP